MNIKKLNNGKVKIISSLGIINTYEDIIINNKLLYKDNLSKEDITTINSENEYYDVYYKTINYIKYKYRSEKEVNKYLSKYELSIDNRKKIIRKLKEINLVNDLIFAKSYIADKVNLSNKGPNVIKYELKKQDIEESIVEKLLNDYNDNIFEEKIKKIVIKKLHNTKYTNLVLKNKLLIYLLNLGYAKDMILKIISTINLKQNNVNDEYNKLYNSLSSRYSNKVLKEKIYNRLLQRGFTYAEINEVKKKED